MKILIVSNFYPPHVIGGYELLCREVGLALVERGHTIKILTSTYGVEKPVVEGDVHRRLALESDLHFYSPQKAWIYPWLSARNVKILREMVAEFQPDLVFVWGMWALGKNIAVEAERLMGYRVVYYFANPWPIQPSLHDVYWNDTATTPIRTTIKRALRLPFRYILSAERPYQQLEYKHAPICSEALRDELLEAGVPLKSAPVIYEGINLPRYLEQVTRRDFSKPARHLSILFVGILAPHKGVHTAIEALGILREADRNRVHLTVLGKGHPEYETRLRNLVSEHALESHVTFHAPIPREELPDFLGKHDVLVLPSIWEEPLALIMQEGLASGMVVVGSATGGTKEIIRNDKNGLLFEAGDAQGLARHLERLLVEPDLMQRLSRQGVKTAEEKFDIDRMVAEIDMYLQSVAANEHAPVFID